VRATLRLLVARTLHSKVAEQGPSERLIVEAEIEQPSQVDSPSAARSRGIWK
jgi:hypothetical protein